jgi:hypothetical protein
MLPSVRFLDRRVYRRVVVVVERLFHQLEVVLELKRFYCAHPIAVAQQVDLDPEDHSPDKIFPRLALASIEISKDEYCVEFTKKANRRFKLRKPDWSFIPETVVSLEHVRVHRRIGKRRQRDCDEVRATWKSITGIEGADDLT